MNNGFIKCLYPDCLRPQDDKPDCILCKVFQHNKEIDMCWQPNANKTDIDVKPATIEVAVKNDNYIHIQQTIRILKSCDCINGARFVTRNGKKKISIDIDIDNAAKLENVADILCAVGSMFREISTIANKTGKRGKKNDAK